MIVNLLWIQNETNYDKSFIVLSYGLKIKEKYHDLIDLVEHVSFHQTYCRDVSKQMHSSQYKCLVLSLTIVMITLC